MRNWGLDANLSEKNKKNIEKISNSIEHYVFNSFKLIEEKSVFKEIRPLIRALNRLILYFEERCHHEHEFASTASHELRTPLSGIRLQTELALRSDDLKLHRVAHHNILKALDRGDKLIDNLLILARLTSNNIELDLQKINLGQLLAYVASGFQNLAEKKKITLRVGPWKKIYIHAHKEYIYVLLRNLIENAIIYTPNGGNVSVKVMLDKSTPLVVISDTGPGIDPDDYQRVLNSFTRGKKDNNEGSGLGLSISKRICDLHQASLKFSESGNSPGLVVSISFKKL